MTADIIDLAARRRDNSRKASAAPATDQAHPVSAPRSDATRSVVGSYHPDDFRKDNGTLPAVGSIVIDKRSGRKAKVLGHVSTANGRPLPYLHLQLLRTTTRRSKMTTRHIDLVRVTS